MKLARIWAKRAWPSLAGRAEASRSSPHGGAGGRQWYSQPAAEEEESLETDVLIVGGGPAGLSAAIRLRQAAIAEGLSLDVTLVEKGAEVGAHILSGAVLEPRGLAELFPDWREASFFPADPPPIREEVKSDALLFLTEKYAVPLPKLGAMHNAGNYIVSLSEVTRWLARRAEEVGVNIYTGFAGSQVLYSTDPSPAADGNDAGTKRSAVVGVRLNDVGRARNGNPKASFVPGMAVRARLQTFLAEGCHGSLSKQVIAAYDLRRGRSHQTYGIGLKEVWQTASPHFERGSVTHSVGWPLDSSTYGGGFIYQYGEGLVSIGLVVGLDYRDPFTNPYKEFQLLKRHPRIRRLLEGDFASKCIAYGARALNEGGVQSIPRVAFPGGALIGCSAGFVNVAKIKGSHTAMKSGILAADALLGRLREGPKEGCAPPLLLAEYEESLQSSWVVEELHRVRNIRPSFHRFGLYGGMIYSGLDQMLFRGRLPWTLAHGPPDHAALVPVQVRDSRAAFEKKYAPAKGDGRLTFDLLESVSRTSTNHEEDQPCHLKLTDGTVPLARNWPLFAGVEGRFCPAGVYEYIQDGGSAGGSGEGEARGKAAEDRPDGSVKFVINAQNCIHCKTCDIKDPSQNITWTPPEGGGGPQYTIT